VYPAESLPNVTTAGVERYTEEMMASLPILWPSVLALLAALQIRAIDGKPLRPMEPAGLANVLLFVSTDCPVSNAYAPELQRICAAYATKGIACSLVYEDPNLTAGEVRKHLDEYRYRAVGAAIDSDGSLAASVRATVTPQAVVIDRRGTVRYSGRIDNLYEAVGRPRRVVTSRDLESALTAIAAGKAPPVPRTDAVGCYIVPSNLRPPSPRLRRPRRH
jgi:hypothetical protein